MMAKSNYEIIKSYAQSPEIIQRFVEITGSERKANSYINSVIIAVSSNDQLKQCTPPSIMKAAADAANLSLNVDPRIGEAYLVPYKNTATLIPGWRGLRNMAYRTRKVLYLNTNAVYEGQEWVEDQLTGQAQIEGSKEPGGKPIGYFAYLETKDHRVNTVYMTVEEIHAHKEQYAPGWKRPGSAWQNEFPKMAKKTVIRQLLTQWAELDPTTLEYLANLGDMDEGYLGEDFPDPSQVTSVEKPKHTNQEILNELYPGEHPDETDDEQEDPNVIDAESKEKVPESKPEPKPKPKPEPKPKRKQKKEKEPEPKDTNYPGSSDELYAWIMQGAIPYIGIKDAKAAVEDSNDEFDIAWESLLALSKERDAQNKKTNKEQPNLI